MSLDSGEKSVGDDGARVGIFEYFEKHWLSSRWRSTVDGKFRALIEKYGINTTNDVELFWNTLKNNWTHGLRRFPALALALILGKPPRAPRPRPTRTTATSRSAGATSRASRRAGHG